MAGCSLIEDGISRVLPVARASTQEWLDVKEFLERECPTWTFGAHLQGESLPGGWRGSGSQLSPWSIALDDVSSPAAS